MSPPDHEPLAAAATKDRRPIHPLVELAPLPRGALRALAATSGKALPQAGSQWPQHGLDSSPQHAQGLQSASMQAAAGAGHDWLDRQQQTQRVEATLEACRVAHANRTFRLNALGVLASMIPVQGFCRCLLAVNDICWLLHVRP
jgi:hypothetical protein